MIDLRFRSAVATSILPASKVFVGELHDGEADEDLSWWETSGGQQLPALGVQVGAQPLLIGPEEESAVQAILTPL